MREIFLVHDELETHWIRQHFLESSGYRVVALKSGQDCLDAMNDHKPDLILMDILIDGRNGFEICRQIRREFLAEELPIILCSEIYRSRLFQDEAINAGAQRYVLKPCRLDELAHTVHEVLGLDTAGVEPDAAA
ncbi:MAG: response regulator [bacterium]|nr:response regulator [bacterium]